MAPLAGPTPRQDWVFGSPQMATAPLNALPTWDRTVLPQPQVQPQLQGSNASMWAPRPTVAPNVGLVQDRRMSEPTLNEPINFLRLLQPTSQPPYTLFVSVVMNRQ
ncbi:hypothetical protein FRC12_002728 [Ceratobasidium sp. 428]|nr:hypothetical protein FRC12_002728 [Ceratobasidium sp. 428]